MSIMVHTSHYSRLKKKRLHRLPPRKDSHVYITRGTYHQAYTRRTQVNWRKEDKIKTKENRKRQEEEARKGKEKKNTILADPVHKRRHWAHRGYQVHHQRHWGENATRRRSQGGVTLTCDGHWKAHKLLQDDDGQTQTGSWVGRPPCHLPPPLPPPPPPPGRLEMPAVDGAAAAFACRSSAPRVMPFPHE